MRNVNMCSPSEQWLGYAQLLKIRLKPHTYHFARQPSAAVVKKKEISDLNNSTISHTAKQMVILILVLSPHGSISGLLIIVIRQE